MNAQKSLLSDKTLNAVTYNIHHGRGNDDVVNLDRIAEVIADTESHVVALQENDIVNGRTGFINQPQVIAANLSELTSQEWVALEAPAIEFSGGEYGNAILYNEEALDLIEFENVSLPGNPAGDGKRSAGIANFQFEDTDFDFQFVATHLTNLNEPTEDDSTIQLDSLDIIDDAVSLNLPVILAGDLNADLNPVLSDGELVDNNPETIEELEDLGYQIVSPFDDDSDTVPSEDFDGVIDYIAIKNGDEFEVESSEIVVNDSTDLASDHYPVTTTFSVSSSVPTPREEALPNTHAHNDYEHQYPLLDALSNGFVSVEADIWLYPDDNENLRVAHDPVEDPTILPTLEELYLDPLQELKEAFDNGGVYADGTPLTLLVDLKSEGLSTYQRLDEVLAEYEAESPGLLTTYTQDESGDYTVTPGAVTPIISGDRPREFMESQEVRYAGYDGRKDDIGTDTDPNFMPLISDNWNNFFTDELAWDGIGEIPEDTEAELNDIVSEVQAEDKIFRFWNLPQDAPNVWEPLYEAGVDLINTDNLEGLSTFIESQLEGKLDPIFGTAEADTIEIEGNNHLVFAGEGNDLIDASLSEGNNRLYGDGGDDTFILGVNNRAIGAAGADRFFVTSDGDNIMTGGEGADQFWIANAELPAAANIITDFTSGEDVLGIAGLGLSFSDLNLTQDGDHTFIKTDTQDLAILSDVAADHLTADNFAFV